MTLLPSSSVRSARRVAFVPSLESLEERALLTTATLTVGVLTIHGTSGDDNIEVRQADGRISVVGVPILVGGVAQADVSASQVTSISVWAKEGRDVVWAGGVSRPAYIRGGPDDDLLTGGAGNDTIEGGGGHDMLEGRRGDDLLMGGAGRDQLWGRDGMDSLYGDDGDDWLDAGSAGETAVGGVGHDVNPYAPVFDGTTYTDIDQGGGPTCWVMASLAAATYRGIDLGSRLTYQGNGVFRVDFLSADLGPAPSQLVSFTNDILEADADFSPNQEDEFWPIVYQRAVLNQVGRSWSRPGYGSTETVLPLLTGHADSWRWTSGLGDTADLAAARVQNLVRSGKAVTALTLDWVPDAVVTLNHWFLVKDVRQETRGSGSTATLVWVVDLYNPYGNNRTVDWADFYRCLEGVAYTNVG